MKRFLTIFIAILTLYTYSSISAANAERTLGFQGQFYTYNTPGNAPVSATFTFYDSLTGGNITGTPISKIIQVVNGYFGTTFSESDTTGVDLNQQLFLEVSINGTTLSPRTTVNPTVSSLKSFGTFSYAVAPTVGPAGSLYFNTTSGELYVSNGTSWQLAGVSSSTTQWTPNGTSLNYMAGNVGIGTTTPESKLTVMGSATAYGTLSSIGTASSSAQLLLSDDVNGYGGIDIYTYGGGALSSPHSYVNLIGSRGTSEAASRVLTGDDIGMLNFYGQADSGLELAAAIGAVAVSDFTGSSAATDLFFITNKAERMRITSGGNVGIGTSTPSESLVIGSDLGEVTTGTGLVVGASSGVAGLNIGKDSTNRAWINWDVSNELVSMGTYASSTVNTNTLVLKDGKVGVGTTTPGVPLDVSWVKNGPTVGNSWVRVMRQASNRDAAFQIQTASGVSSSSPQWNFGVPNSTNNFAIYGWDGTTISRRLTIDTTGNIGIGTSTPSQKLDVWGNLQVGTSSIPALYVDSGTSRIGIGTTTPGRSLVVAGVGMQIYRTGGAVPHLEIIQGAAGTDLKNWRLNGETDGSFTIYPMTDANSNLRPLRYTHDGRLQITNATPSSVDSRLFVDSGNVASTSAVFLSGSVGIGTTTPSTMLSVVGTSYFSGNMGIGSQALARKLAIGAASDSLTGIQLNANNTSWYLDHRGSNDSPSNRFGISTGATEFFTILPGGNVGIGTSSPISKFTVAGAINSTDLLGGATTLSTDANGNIIRTPSDQKLKTNVETLTSALDKVNQMRGVSYSWIDTERFGKDKEIGFIAQELETIVPEVVKSGGEYKSVNYQNLTALLTEAIKELSAKFDGLTKKVETEELCMKRKNGTQVCIDAEQLDQLLMEKASQSSVQQTPPPTIAPVEPEVSEEPAPTPEPVAPPAEEPAPVASPTE